jgi:hypothetical protein
MVEWRYRSTIFDLGTRWRWVINFTPLPLYPRRNSPYMPIVLEIGWVPEQAWTLWKRENLLLLSGIKPRILGRPARSPSQYRHPVLAFQHMNKEKHFQVSALLRNATRRACSRYGDGGVVVAVVVVGGGDAVVGTAQFSWCTSRRFHVAQVIAFLLGIWERGKWDSISNLATTASRHFLSALTGSVT